MRDPEPAHAPAFAFHERNFEPVNWLGFWTLYIREVRRFAKIHVQTITAPVVTTLLYLSVFVVAMGRGRGADLGGFLAPGLIMLSMTQNAFANTSSSVTIGKVQGNIVDLLMPPLSPIEVTLALVLGGVTRGVVVGAAVLISMLPFVDLHIAEWGWWNWGLILFHAVMGSLMLSTFGVIGGLWSDKFDHIAAVTNFVVMPLTFLSGTFYRIDQLTPSFRWLAWCDPLFYLIDGFRAGFLGHSEASLTLGAGLLTVLNIALLILAWYLIRIGYKIKS